MELPVREQKALVAANRDGLNALRQVARAEIHVPPESTDKTGFYLPMCRESVRMLAVAEQLAFADGSTRKALADLFDGIRLGQTLQQATFTTCRVGVACESLVAEPFAKNLDRLSPKDCEAILDVIARHLKEQIPIASIAAGEDREIHDMLIDLVKRNEKDLIHDVSRLPGGENIEDRLRKDPHTWEKLIRRSDQVRGQIYRAFVADMAKPFRQRTVEGLKAPPDDLLTQIMIDALYGTGNLKGFSIWQTAREAHLKLIGLHAAIAAYRLEHGKLPDALADLRQKDRTIDPFSGEQFRYARDKSDYRLYSVGADLKDDGGKPGKGYFGKGDLFLTMDGSR